MIVLCGMSLHGELTPDSVLAGSLSNLLTPRLVVVPPGANAGRFFRFMDTRHDLRGKRSLAERRSIVVYPPTMGRLQQPEKSRLTIRCSATAFVTLQPARQFPPTSHAARICRCASSRRARRFFSLIFTDAVGCKSLAEKAVMSLNQTCLLMPTASLKNSCKNINSYARKSLEVIGAIKANEQISE